MLLMALSSVGELSAQNRALVTSRRNRRGTHSAIVTPARRVTRNNGLHTGRIVGSHFLVGASVDAGYTVMTTDMPAISMWPGGGQGSLGLVIAYQKGAFDFQTGMVVRYQRLENSVNDFVYTRYGVEDSWTGTHDWQYADVTYAFSQRKDLTQNVYFHVPILFGGSTQLYNGSLYFLTGVKLQYAMAGSTRSTALCTTTAEYDRYIGSFTGMDNHGWRKDVQISSRADRPELKLDLLGSLEIGYEYGNPHYRGYRRSQEPDWRVRWGLFADYSTLSVMPSVTGDLVRIPSDTPYDFGTFQMNHPFGSTASSGYWMRNLFVGFRMTVTIGIKMQEKCLMCQAFNGGRRR